MILSALLHSLAELTEAEPRPEAHATARSLRAAAETAFPPSPPSLLDAAIRAACALPHAHPAARLIAEAQAWLPWQASPAASLQPAALAATKAVVTLLSPEGPIHAPDLRFGLFYQAPGIYYPLHAHEAAETYTILAGAALWQAGDHRFPLTPGQSSYHPPNLPHAMRAGPDGFLALWRWSGDIGFDSYRMLPDPEADHTCPFFRSQISHGGPGGGPRRSAKGTTHASLRHRRHSRPSWPSSGRA